MKEPLMKFRLNGWTVTPSECSVRKGPRTVHLEPRAMDVLVYLAQHRDRVVSNDELRDQLWGESFVVKQAVTRCVVQIRRAFDDDFRDPRFVATISKRGYRLVGELDSPVPPSRPSHRLMALGIVLLLLLLMVIILVWRSSKA